MKPVRTLAIIGVVVVLFFIANASLNRQAEQVDSAAAYEAVEPAPVLEDVYEAREVPAFSMVLEDIPNQAGMEWAYGAADDRTFSIRLIGMDSVGGRDVMTGLRYLDDAPVNQLYIDTADGAYTEFRSLADGAINMRYEFPLEPGASWTYAYPGEDGEGNPVTIEQRVTVQAAEEITVPAGTFKTLRLHSQRVGSDVPGPVIWTSPGVGTVRLRLYDGSAAELESFSKPEATGADLESADAG